MLVPSLLVKPGGIVSRISKRTTTEEMIMKALKTGALGLAVALAACNTDGSGPDLGNLDSRLLNRDVALATADAATQDVEIMGGPTGAFGFGLAPSFASSDDPASRPFRCGTHERDALTITRTCTFKDANGATQTSYDSVTTASATIQAEIKGTITRENWSATVSRTRNLVVTGLAGAETSRTWNGTGSGSALRSRHSDNGDPRQYDITGTTTITNVVVGIPRSENTWPLSGTVTHQATIKITGGPNDGQTRTRTATITFNGTQFVPIVVNGNQFTFDLALRKIVRDDS